MQSAGSNKLMASHYLRPTQAMSIQSNQLHPEILPDMSKLQDSID